VLQNTGGEIANSNVFSGLAEEFSMALDRERKYLRNLNNPSRVQDVPSHDPHELSTVLSGAFYQVLLSTYSELRLHYPSKSMPDPSVVSEPEVEYVEKTATTAGELPSSTDSTTSTDVKALFAAAERIKRTLLRGLDYLLR
jgi:hypothetical protein